MAEPLVQSKSEPISEIQKVTTVTNPVGQKNVTGTQINPATEDTLAAQLNITLSAFRDAIVNATTPKDLLAIFNQLASTLSRNTAQWGGTALTGRDISLDLAKLDIALSALRDALRGASTKDFTTLETDIESILAKLDVALSTRATEATVAKLMPTVVTKYAVSLTSANTEYSQALPANTKKFRIHLRDFSEFRLAYVTGKVATPTDPYETIPAGSEKYEDGLNIASLTLYFASSIAEKTAEVEAWS